MISPRPSLRPPVLTAVAGALLLLATACGTSVSGSIAERAVAPVESEASAPVPPEAPAPAPPVEAGGHEYGTSIEDWGGAASDEAEPVQQGRSDYTEIEWPDLIPEGMAANEIFARYEERFDDLEVGSPQAEELYAEMLAEMDSGAVNAELEGRKVRLAGFVAPLTYEDDIVIEFLLVPNFGACIHVPPPPPNQTIVVTVDKENGLTLEESWGPVWVEGTMSVSAETTDLAAASYTLTSAISGVYEF